MNLQLFGGRGSKGVLKKSKQTTPEPESEYDRNRRRAQELQEQREAENRERIEQAPKRKAYLDEHFKKVNAALDDFMNLPDPKGDKALAIEDYEPLINTLDDGYSHGYVNRYSKEYMIKQLKYLNDGDSLGDDGNAYITYKDGTTRIIENGLDKGDKKIKLTNLQSIVIDTGYGTDMWGKGLRLFNFREYDTGISNDETKQIESMYKSWDDIRWDFK